MLSGPIFAAMKTGELSYSQGFLRLLAVYGVPFLFVITEPDLGTSLVLIFMFLATTFVWGVRWRTILLSVAGMIFLVLPLSWNFALNATQKERIMTFLFRGHDKTASYHINQSLAAVASGGLAGNRTGENVSVPVKESDFIFPAISEQLGLIGTTVVILLAAYFIFHTFRVASKIHSRSPEESYIMVALISGLAFHFVENIGMTVGLLPITGIPLPFISYGGSAMISNFLLLGVLLNYSMNYKEKAGT
jgi:rod shape determining protein RodA